MLNNALDMFGIKKDDLKDKTKFNARSVEKKYKLLSRVHQPDKGGNPDTFIALNSNFGLLMALCEKNETKKQNKQGKDDQKEQLAINYKAK